jgi:hypothetical protein
MRRSEGRLAATHLILLTDDFAPEPLGHSLTHPPSLCLSSVSISISISVSVSSSADSVQCFVE